MKNWIPEVFEVFTDGISSALEPEIILDSQLAWGTNVKLRGGKPSTRQPLVQRLELPDGQLQGSSCFSIQNGMLIISIAGKIYRIDVNGRTFEQSQIAADLINSSAKKHVWMCETAGSLIIQDDETDAIIYDGSIARRPDRSIPEVPLGRQSAYGNGRLWTVINDNEVVAGDIKTSAKQSELVHIETGYLFGGGAFYFPRKISGVAFIPTASGQGQGGLLVFGKFYAEVVRADITSRDLWDSYPGFVSSALLGVGAAGQDSIVEVNQDLYWRDSEGGIRSFTAALRDQNSAGNVPLSDDVRRITEKESKHLLEYCSAIAFGNRLLMTASPYRNKSGGVSFRDIIALDFTPLAARGGKVQPAYDGQWNGIGFAKLLTGEFAGVKRAFAISSDKDGKNRLWEFVDNERDDASFAGKSPIKSSIEFKRRNFSAPHVRKKLVRCDVYLEDIEGPVTLEVYWRVDNDPVWQKWDSISVEAKMTYPVEMPMKLRLLSAQHRPQIRTFTASGDFDPITKRARHVGVDFQIRLVWTGKLKIFRTVIWADFDVGQDAVANRQEFTSTPVFQDVTSAEKPYSVPTI